MHLRCLLSDMKYAHAATAILCLLALLIPGDEADRVLLILAALNVVAMLV